MSEQFEKGLKIRREVLGANYVDGSIARADDFMMAFQNITARHERSSTNRPKADVCRPR